MSVRVSLFAIALLSSLPFAAAFGDPPAETSPLVNHLQDSSAGADALARLGHQVASVSLTHASLEDVLRIVETGAGVRIETQWDALAAAGLKRDTTITIQGSQLAYLDYLRAIGVQTHAPLALDFRGKDGVLLLTTAKAYAPQMDDDTSTRADVFRSLVPEMIPRLKPAGRLAAASRDGKPEAADPLDSPAELATRRDLEITIKELRFDQVSLEKAIETLRASTPVTFNVNWNALQNAGITKDTPVSANFVHLPVSKALAILLHQAGGGSANVTYTVDGGVVTISTMDDLQSEKYQIVRVFDVRDFLAPSPNGASDNVVREIVETIKSTIAPESWKDAGGAIGTIRELGGQLIINQSNTNQHAIYHLLSELRQRKKTPPARSGGK